MLEQLPQLTRWNAWANRQVLETLRASSGEPPEALAAYQHVLETELVWLRRMTNDPQPMLKLWGPASLANCEAWTTEASGLWTTLLASLDAEGLGRTFTYRNSTGQEFTDRLAEPTLQTLFHSSQYRGEAAAFLNHAGHRVPDLDFIYWLRLGAPD